ncbi:MAG: hypothetical protein RI925_742 [Pseudomonadota bacterium]|jgi:predicted nucleic acid-binding protein
MILVDSSVWIDYFRGTPSLQAECLDQLLSLAALHWLCRRPETIACCVV